MRARTLTLLALAALCACEAAPRDYRAEFAEWCARYNKLYTDAEREVRYGVWLDTVRFVDEWNAAAAVNGGHEVEANAFADLTPAERSERLTALQPDAPDSPRAARDAAYPWARRGRAVADKLDWRTQNVIGAVRNQANCGGCWAFATTQTVEPRLMITGQTKAILHLSEQMLLDCTPEASGCKGGNQYYGYRQGQLDHGGFMLDSDYPFTSGTSGVAGSCKKDSNKAVAWAKGAYSSTEGVEADMMDMLQQVGPVSVAIDASSDSLKTYKSGIYTGPCSSSYANANHAVVVVGWDKTASPAYWIVKNSWGAQWGESGYFRLAIGTNRCGLANQAMAPALCNGTVADCGSGAGSIAIPFALIAALLLSRLF